MTRKQPDSSGGARRTRCRCGLYVLRQDVGGLIVNVDTGHLQLAEARALSGPNRLAWCLYQRTVWSPIKLRSASASTHPEDCPHPHVVDHECAAPPPTSRPAARRSARTMPVHPGQLTL
ncbi:hypothetical protein [Streptomyces sp. NBC_01373]|uniref:hypothetical protein n=1 Tax=Streptomyces sp. NBC_01373 TaxID=2903843 RepID=UPI00225A7BA1|nr:hypothetical protein [Streptomyces sp. NBC_01373]MCX4705679.1 hypothetical protein [Streptomyces sp. NBC_01373]